MIFPGSCAARGGLHSPRATWPRKVQNGESACHENPLPGCGRPRRLAIWRYASTYGATAVLTPRSGPIMGADAARKIPLAVAEAADGPVVTAEGIPNARCARCALHPAACLSARLRCQSLPVPCTPARPVRPDPAATTLPQRSRPDRRPGDQASDLHFLVAGAGFEPATSGL